MQVADVMTTKVVTVTPETDVSEIAKLLIKHRISGVPVVDAEGAVVGIVSEGDLIHRPESGTEARRSWWLELFSDSADRARDYVKTHGHKAEDVMTHDVITTSPSASLDEVATTLERHRIKRLPVLDGGRLVGIVSRANLLHGLVAQAKAGPAPTKSDQQIRTALLAAIDEAGVGNTFINVIVTKGVVQIWGMVGTDDELKAIEIAAGDTPGIKKLENHVGVMSRMVKSGLWAE
jgi:CBS domain-containing protein